MDTKKYTASSFRKPLLAALGQLSGLKADNPIERNLVIKIVLGRLELDEDALGTKHQKLETHRLIGLAFRAARTLADPLTISPRKNKWALTQRGVEEAARLLSPTKIGVVLDVQEVEVNQHGQVEVNQHGQPELESEYSDLYIESLAASQSACYGVLYAAKETICQDCPLMSSCRKAMCGELGQIAAAIQKAEQPEEQEAEQTDLPATPEISLTREQISAAARITLNDSANVNPLCQKCGKPIQTGKQCMFTRDLGCFHLRCWSEATS